MTTLKTIEQYCDYLLAMHKQTGVEITTEAIENVLFLGNIYGKTTPYGQKSAYELGMEPDLDELAFIDAVQDAVDHALLSTSN